MHEMPPKYRIGSIDFTASTFAKALDLIDTAARRSTERGTSIHFANAYNIALAEHDSDYQQVMNSGDLVFTDGTPVVWAGKRLFPGHRWERVYGPDAMQAILAQRPQIPNSHYFLGATPDTLQKLVQRVRSEFPNAVVAGFESPPFATPTQAELRERDLRIKKSGASIVWVGLGTPKQDYEVNRLAANMNVTAIAVGAAFDFIAGAVSQAPAWMQKYGLEWSYRLAKEPRRLARRYLWGNPQFVSSVVRHRNHEGADD
jgi:N-acetylglucosaminyldiphosphoundecaprenol N-acetyl-beta-D-mannosaminyltransferase